jgi:uncharacterized membrane protein
MPTHRINAIDTVRGLAMVWMTAFHLCFDLSNAGILAQDFHQNPVWTWQRTAILSLFLLCAGAGQAAAQAQGQSGRQFGWRLAQITAAAALVSLGSWFMFPGSFIYFGVLHGMAVMLVLLRLVAPWVTMNARPGWGCAAVGLLVIATHLIAGGAIAAGVKSVFGIDLDSRSLNWLGLITRLPITEDYVPIVPWWGVMLLGCAGMQRWLAADSGQTRATPPQRQAAPASWLVCVAWVSWPCGALARLGRHSLMYYLLHQPVMLGLLWLAGVR